MCADAVAVVPRQYEDERSQEDLRELARRVGQLVDSGLCAYLCRARTVTEFTSWLDKADPQQRADITCRLSAVLDLAVHFRVARYLSRMPAWLTDPDPVLGGLSPADVIRQSADKDTVSGLHAVAERYLSDSIPWYRSRVPLR